MSKNIFSVLQNDDSDNETNKTQNKQAEQKPNKKENRAQDQLKREHFGDQFVKDANAQPKLKDGPKIKGDYNSGEKRPFERHSGTGRPAFTHDPKKGGHGKGNVGGESEIKDELVGEKKQAHHQTKEAVVEVPEPKEEIITLDEYVTQFGFNTEFLKKEEDIKITSTKSSDPNVKFVVPKEKDAGVYNKKNLKHVEDFVKVGGKNIVIEAPANTLKTKQNAPKKNSKMEFNEHNFPALS